MKNNLLKVSNSWWMIIPLAILYAIVGVFGISHHEMWLDETHHWLLAKDSLSFGEMVTNAQYEGHPLLWNALLFLLTRFTSAPFSMQLLNLGFSILAVIIVLRNAPFSWLVKILLVFSYFIFYEYSIIARNYSLAFLLLVMVCVLFKERQKRFLLFSFVLVLLAQTHLFAAVISSGIVLLILWEKITAKKNGKENSSRFFIPGIIFISISLLLVVYFAIPPSDHFLYSYNEDSLLSFKRIGKGLSVLWKGLFPIPDFGNDYPWNSNLIINFSKKLAVIPAALAWLVPLVLIRKRKLLVFFYGVAAILVLFIYFSPLIVASRHCGFFFLLLLISIWLAEYFPEADVSGNATIQKLMNRTGKFVKPLFIFILGIQVISGIYLYITDWSRPFSNGKAVAEWIKLNRKSDELIIVSDHSSGPPISSFLGRKVYYAECNSYGSFCNWNTNPFIISQKELMEKTVLLLNENSSSKLLLITNRPLAPGFISPKVKLLSKFENALVRAEDYTVYEVSK